MITNGLVPGKFARLSLSKAVWENGTRNIKSDRAVSGLVNRNINNGNERAMNIAG